MDPELLPDDLKSQISITIEQKKREVATSTFCIYSVPGNLIETNGKDAYYPRVVSIGPRHTFDDAVKVMEKHKLEFVADLFMRKNLDFNDLMESIRPLEKEARECYSNEMIIYLFPDDNDDRFLKTMFLDGCFLIELFLKAADKKSKDPLALIPRAVPYVYGDLLLLQNQIPFFVLEQLFTTIINKPDASETSRMPEESNASLSFLALRFFNKVMQRPDRVIEKFLESQTAKDEKPLHLLDLVRSSLLPLPSENMGNTPTACRRIHSISKLHRRGIQLKRRKADSFLDVKFRKGVIQMPKISMNDNMKTFLLNCLAFEHLHNSRSKHFTVYATFLDCIVDTTGDVNYLCERGIFDNHFGNYDAVAKFINKLRTDISFDDGPFYLSQLFKQVETRYDHNPVKKQWASFKNRYFNTPWTFISALAALVLLVLTFLQTYYTIYAYVNPKS